MSYAQSLLLALIGQRQPERSYFDFAHPLLASCLIVIANCHKIGPMLVHLSKVRHQIIEIIKTQESNYAYLCAETETHSRNQSCKLSEIQYGVLSTRLRVKHHPGLIALD